MASPAASVVPIAMSLAVVACGPVLTNAPVPRPFPSPAGTAVENRTEAGTASTVPGSGADFFRYLEIVEQVETGGDCLARPAGSSAIGCYQMTSAALMDAGLKDVEGDWLDNPWGIDSDDEFRRNRRAQAAAMLRYTTANWQRLEPCVRDLIGTTVGGIALDQGALVAGAHLLGPTGLVRFVRCGLQAHCFPPPVAALNGGGHKLRAHATRHMSAASGLRVLESQAGTGSRCALQT